MACPDQDSHLTDARSRPRNHLPGSAHLSAPQVQVQVQDQRQDAILDDQFYSCSAWLYPGHWLAMACWVGVLSRGSKLPISRPRRLSTFSLHITPTLHIAHYTLHMAHHTTTPGRLLTAGCASAMLRCYIDALSLHLLASFTRASMVRVASNCRCARASTDMSIRRGAHGRAPL
jgi:hypothetical protein